MNKVYSYIMLTVRPLHGDTEGGKQLCVVCSDVGNGIHFGALTCEGCKVIIGYYNVTCEGCKLV